MTTVTLKGNPIAIKGSIPEVNSQASNFVYVKSDLSEGSLEGLGASVKVLLAVPSLDTGVCAMETKKFNEEVSSLEGVETLVISKDLPFAMGRFCEANNVDRVTSASDFRYNSFTQQYNTEIMEGPLKGLSCRAVFVLDGQNQVAYRELVPEITQEPNYEAALTAVKALL